MDSAGRRRWIVGNWKMHGTPDEGSGLARALVARLGAGVAGVEVVLCPPFTSLPAVAAATAGTALRLGAQDVFWEDRGPYTGEVAPPMLAALGCGVVIVGHSERRRHLGESDGMVRRKLAACWRGGLLPLLCVGETVEERAGGAAAERVRAQVAAALAGTEPGPLLVAYEPVWAIGAGRAAQPQDSREAIAAIRAELGRCWGSGAVRVACLYGGSVGPENCRPFWEDGGADGVLVGGASLDAEAFAAICRAAERGGGERSAGAEPSRSR